MKKAAKFEDLFQQGMQDLYDAEKQIVAALPKVIAASSSEELSAALATHLEESKDQVARFESIFEHMAEQPGARQCRPMQALLDEAERLVGEMEKSPVLDAALIDNLRKVKHYEIAGYAAV